MNYHGMTKTSFTNGTGIRTVLWVAGCEHHCKGCHNPDTWDVNSGMVFGDRAKQALFECLERTWVDGLTISGGDPLHPLNREDVTALAREVKEKFPHKTIWIYTGFTYEEVCDLEVMQYVDIVVDGKFVKELADKEYLYAGSTNQRIIDVRRNKEWES